MNEIKQFILKVFFLLGERLAIIFIFFAAALVFFTQSSEIAFSQTSQTQVLTMDKSVVSGFSYNIPPPSSPTPTSTPTPTVTPTPTETPTSTANVDPGSDNVWNRLATCESNDNWSDNTGNGYYGGLQFSQSAWQSVGGTGSPAQASQDDQIAKGKLLQARSGWRAWGACAKKLGLD